MAANKATATAEGRMVKLESALWKVMAPPNTPTKSTAIHIATIDTVAHISVTRIRAAQLSRGD
jgi:hypothetical protein